MRSEDCIVISDKMSNLNIYGKVQHPINGYKGEAQRATQLIKGMNRAKCWVTGYNVSGVLRRV
jgi:hypothetical protein